MTKKTLLVTGAAGFIGFHLCLHLAALGNTVIGVDNYNNYYDPTLKFRRAEILGRNGIRVVEGDVRDFSLLESLVVAHKATHLVHLAAQAGVRYSIVNPQAYIDSNMSGFLTILELTRLHQLKLTYASSSSVYGLNRKVPFTEEDRTDHQASFYGVTKKANELMADTYRHLYQIAAVGLRFFTVYGPWGRPDMAYYSFAEAISTGKPIAVYNFGKMKRDFTYITDIVQGISAAIDYVGDCPLFNLGNHHPEELGELIKLLEEGLGKQAVLQLLPMQPGDVESTYASIDLSHRELGFESKVSLKEGIHLFLDWFKAHR